MKHLYKQLKIQRKALIVGILLVLNVTTGYSQTTLMSENFEGGSNQVLTTAGGYNNWYVYLAVDGESYWYITSSYYSYCMISGSYALSVTSDDYYCTYGNSGGYAYSSNKIAYKSFSASGYSSLTLSFNYKAGGETGYDYGKVCYSTNGTTWTDLATTYTNKASTTAVTNLALPSSLNGLSTVYIGFRWVNNNNYVDPSTLGFVVDDIVVKGSAACTGTPSAPVATAATNVGPNSFTANWNASANASAYYLDVSTSSSFTTLLTSYNNKSVGNVTTYDVSGLTTGVTYYYRVRAKCVGTSGNSNTINLTTAANYCNAGPTSGSGDGITRVTFNTISNTTPINEYYGDYTSVTTPVSINSTYTLSVKVTTFGALTNYQKAWIDWNHDGTFATTAAEEYNLGTAAGTNVTTSLSPKSITVPATAIFGSTRMRIMTREGANPTSCDNFNYGEAEDYTLIVGNPPGASYGVYSGSAICASCITDCEIYAQGGSGTAGCLVCSPTDASYTNVNISDYSVITATNASCYNTNVTVTTAAPSPVWTGSSGALTGSGSPKTFQYTSTGRKDIVLASTQSCTGAAAQTATVNTAITDNGCASNITVSSNITVPSYGSCKINTANMSIKVNITHGDDQDVMIYLKAPNGKLLCVSTGNGGTGNNYTNTVFSDGGTYNISSGSVAAPYTGTYKPEGSTGASSCGAPTSGVTTFATLGGSSYNPTGVWTLYVGDQYSGSSGTFVDWTLTLPASTGTGGTTTNTYTGFANMMMAPPSAGAVKGTATGCAGGTYTYSSTAAGTPGFTYSWSVSPSTGTSITSPLGSSTNITFPTTVTTYTVSCVETSECCGALTAITYTTSITAAPTAPTVTVANTSPCIGSTTTLTPTAPANATFNFYSALTGGTLLGNTIPYTTPALNGPDTVYVEAISASGCNSTPRTRIIINPVATTPPTVSGVTRCGTGDVTLEVTSPGASYTYEWHSGSCAGTLLQSNNGISYTASNLSSTTTYYVSATPRGCGASLCTAVTATVNGQGTSYTWAGTVSGANNWFTAANWGGAGCIPTCASDVTIPASSGYTYAPDIGYNAAGGAAVKSITLTNTCTLSFSDAKAELSICGNFAHNGTLTTNGKGSVIFSGTVAQTYSKAGTGSGDFNDVKLNNTAGTATLTLSNDMTLGTGGSFTFVSGKVITGTNNLIIKNTESSAVSGHNVSRYVEGNLRRYINTGTPTSYDFPVGNAAKGYELANVNFTTAPTTITYLTANFNAYGTLPTALNVSECFATYNQSALNHGYWDISANNTQNNVGMYNMTLYNRGYTNAQSGFSIMSQHNASGTWGLLNGDGTASTCINTPITATERRNMKGFSKFGIAQSTSVLPIELLSFDAIYNGSTTDVNWETASETNNNYFTIERSTDASEFKIIAKVPSKAKGGNSTSMLSYTLNDPDVQKGVYYYRLKQTDYDGKTTVSSIATVNIDDHQPLTVTPNPTENTAEISFEAYSTTIAMLKVYDTRGRLVLAREVMCNKGHNTHTIDLHNEISGVFYIVLNVGDKIYNTKLLKQ
jgi:subtilisin-like proprotein convertase family protein